MASNDEEDDGFGQYVATQEFIETSEAIASLYHHSLKVLIEVKDLPFVLGRDKTKASVVTHDPNLEATKQKCSISISIFPPPANNGGFLTLNEVSWLF